MAHRAQRQSTVDPAEVERFSALAEEWWDPRGKMAPLHRFNPVRLGYIRDRAAARFGRDPRRLDSLKELRILDIGCGGGILSESLAALGAGVTGIDLSEKALGVARLHLFESGHKVDYQHTSAEQFADQHPEQFDVVTCMEMLEHVPDPASVVAACGRLVKPGGWVFFSTLNRNAKSYLFAVVGAEYILKLLPRGTHDYAKFVKPAELARMAREAGLDTEELIGMTYNPLTKVYRLEADTDVNYLLATRRGD